MNHFSDSTIHLDEYAKLLKALAHPVRLCIVQGLLKCDGCNVSDIQNCLDIPQSTLSQHLATLRHSGIIVGDRNGLEIIYKVIHPKVPIIIDVLFNE